MRSRINTTPPPFPSPLSLTALSSGGPPSPPNKLHNADSNSAANIMALVMKQDPAAVKVYVHCSLVLCAYLHVIKNRVMHAEPNPLPPPLSSLLILQQQFSSINYDTPKPATTSSRLRPTKSANGAMERRAKVRVARRHSMPQQFSANAGDPQSADIGSIADPALQSLLCPAEKAQAQSGTVSLADVTSGAQPPKVSTVMLRSPSKSESMCASFCTMSIFIYQPYLWFEIGYERCR